MNEAQEQARTRRRWINLGEAVAVAGVVIAGLTLYNGWSERRAEDAAKTEAAVIEQRADLRVDLKGTAASGGSRLALADTRHDLQDVTITFPKALGVAPQSPTGEPAIAAEWIEPALLKATDGGPDEREGRLPVLITARFLDDDAPRAVTGTYDIIWRTEGRMLRSRALRLEGLKLRQRGGTQTTIDAAWARALPKR